MYTSAGRDALLGGTYAPAPITLTIPKLLSDISAPVTMWSVDQPPATSAREVAPERLIEINAEVTLVSPFMPIILSDG